MTETATIRSRTHGVSKEEFELILQEMVRLIVAEVDPEQIILFGSRARGDARPDSDVDLMIVYDGENQQKSSLQLVQGLYATLPSFGIAQDLVAFSKSEFERRKLSKFHITGSAFRQGKLVYERC